MALIGMADVAKRLGLSCTDTARQALQRAGVELTRIGAHALAVEEAEVEKMRLAREAAGYKGRGRPAGTFKLESPRSKAYKQSKPEGKTPS